MVVNRIYLKFYYQDIWRQNYSEMQWPDQSITEMSLVAAYFDLNEKAWTTVTLITQIQLIEFNCVSLTMNEFTQY